MILSGIRDYWRQWRFGEASGETSKDEGQQFPYLREFVYIDQRSVRSLLASTDSGRIAAEQTNRESNLNSRSYTANAGAGAGPVNVGGGTSRTSQQGSETENTYSFDLIQSKFTRLYEHEEITPKISLTTDEEYELQGGLELSELGRGDVLELHGTIQLHPLYRVYRAIEYIDTAAPDESIIAEGEMQLIEESLGDKIPIEIEANGLSTGDNGDIQEDSDGDVLNVVALLDESELWTEPIQTLASSKQFRVFCRVEAVRSNWYPMKLIRVLESISPNLAETYNKELEAELQAAMNAFEASVEASNQRSGGNKQKIRNFAKFLGAKAECPVEDTEIDDVVDHADGEFSPDATVAFEQEVELLKQTHDSFVSVVSGAAFSDDASSLRSEYRQEQMEQSQADGSERDFTAHLQVNVIGIYW